MPRISRHQIAWTSRPHVALLVETSLSSGRDILRGIARYVREQKQWSIYHEPRSLEESFPRWLKDWKGDGIIVRVQNRKMAEAVMTSGVPAVDVLGLVADTGIPLVHVDNKEIARLAAEHLLERGFRRFAYFGLADENWSVGRKEHFAARLHQSDSEVLTYELPRTLRGRAPWEQRQDQLASWITKLPKPVGVLVCSDQLGLDFLEACRRAEVAVPDEVAVIGVDNDEVLCEVSYPALSSVWPAHSQVGYEAAALLDRLITGQPKPEHPILIAPAGVVTRHSTDVLAIQDRPIAKALHVIREHACDGLTVEDVARHAGLSRSLLQARFRKALGKTIHEEILNVRLQRACQLIVETDLPLIEVAEKSGFKHQEYMGVVFKFRLGKTPAQYRREVGHRSRNESG